MIFSQDRDYDLEHQLSSQQESLQLLAAASDLLADCMDYESTLEKVAKLVVSSFASWCAIDLLNDDHQVERVIVAHQDPRKLPLVREMKKKYPPSPLAKRGVYAVIASRKSILISEVPREAWEARAESPEHLQLIEDLGSKSYMCLPLIARGSVLGSVMILSDQRTYREADLETAEKLARCLALAVDNVSHFRKLNRAIEARDRFLSVATHEIRTPLVPIVLRLEMIAKILKKPNFQEVDLQFVRKSLDIFHSQIQRLGTFINKILDMSRIDAHKLELDCSEVYLSELLKEVCLRYSPQASAANCRIHTVIQEGGDRAGWWDRDRLEQVVTNLISNSIKYGAGNPIQAMIEVSETEAILTVQDHGIGIAPEDQLRIFEPFERLKTKPEVSGVGLGMYISKEIIKAHSGEISVQSRLGEGATFIVRLPLLRKSEQEKLLH